MKHAIIFCNGEISESRTDFPKLNRNTLLIAADGGTRHCRKHNWIPHIVIGDGDSLSEKDRQFINRHKIALQTHPCDKDATDFELALRFADAQVVTRITVLGALGGRWDMSFANLLLAAHADFSHLRIVFRGTNVIATLVHAGYPYHLKGEIDTLISLLPMGGNAQGVTLKGCRWPLDKATLPQGTTRGVSNRIQAEKILIQLEKGCLLVMQILEGPLSGGRVLPVRR